MFAGRHFDRDHVERALVPSIRRLYVAGTILAGLVICGHSHSQEHTLMKAFTLLPRGRFGNQIVAENGRPITRRQETSKTPDCHPFQVDP